jgi:hypothetical protein
MMIILNIDVSLFVILFFIAGFTGFIVRIDQWIEGGIDLPRNDRGKISIFKIFISLILVFIISGIAGLITAIGSEYIFDNIDTNILIFVAILSGAIGKIVFYKLVDMLYDKLENVSGQRNSRRRI